MKFNILQLLRFVVIFAATPAALATTWYVNGVSGRDSNNCNSALAACKTSGHAISHASSGDSIVVAAATYPEHLTVLVSLRIIGANARTTIIDGGGVNTLVTIPNTKLNVTLSNLIIRNGTLGISNNGTLLVSGSSINRNIGAGGIINFGAMTIRNSTISENVNRGYLCCPGMGGGIANHGTLTLSNSTVFRNAVTIRSTLGFGGGILNGGTLTLSNSTINGNRASAGGGIYNGGRASLQNSIVAYDLGGECTGSVTSDGYNLSSDNSCDLHGPGDHNNTDPLLGVLQNNGGPTDTMALQNGSPAIDSGNPSGCTDGRGHLLKTDQRSMPRPNSEDKIGCDIGAYERQGD